jgi:raffinose synthase
MPTGSPSNHAALFSSGDATIIPQHGAVGIFLSTSLDVPAARFTRRLGTMAGFRRGIALFRYEPFWMKPHVVTRLEDVPADTQLLFAELDDGDVAIIAPLVSDPFRMSLKGTTEGLVVIGDTGDPTLFGTEALLAFVASGSDLHELVQRASPEVAQRLGTVRLRHRDHPPDFVDQFGWCTWDAFYRDVSHERVKEGLESFRAGGVSPRVVILDDGWQSTNKEPTGEERLTAFDANEKFPGGLTPTVRLAKEAFGVRTFLVWHAVHGYWGGLGAAAFPDLEITTAERNLSPEILTHFPNGNWEWWGALVGRPSAAALAHFYDRYHLELAAQGVDGVKVDNQASVEGVARGAGGRTAYAAAVRSGLEASVARHFAGRLINCMSCSTDLVYRTARFGLTRSSTDFWPNRPESHGLHATTNALVSLWFGQFIDPDWDMFQSGHPAGRFHAALRAVSGGPVYVSDKPGVHDFALLRKLVLSDGSVLRARHPGRPTRDCLFEDTLSLPVLFKIWNENECSAVIGAFNARYREGGDPILGALSPSDVPTLTGDDFAVYRHHAATLARARRLETVPLTLDTLEAEVVIIAPIADGFAALGLADMLNGGGAVTSSRRTGAVWCVRLKDGGRFVAFCEAAPKSVRVDHSPVTHRFDAHLLSVDVVPGGPRVLEIEL